MKKIGHKWQNDLSDISGDRSTFDTFLCAQGQSMALKAGWLFEDAKVIGDLYYISHSRVEKIEDAFASGKVSEEDYKVMIDSHADIIALVDEMVSGKKRERKSGR